MTIERTRLAIYLFLTEIGICERRKRVFAEKPTATREDIEYVLGYVLPPEAVKLVINMRAFLDCATVKYFDEEWLIQAGWMYAKLPYADNTFRERYGCTLLGCKNLARREWREIYGIPF